MNRYFSLILFFFGILLISNCARTGRPEGGPKDETAPVFVVANPPYESINFDSKRIRLEFDEFVQMRDLPNQLVVSPPLKNPLNVFPQGAASKVFKIDILDTLATNTTYIFNFGSAVQDNNEGNKLENFKYVFSTGDYIDSLTSAGSVEDINLLKDIKNVNMLLYRLDTSYNDSVVFKQKPNYVTTTLDTTLFEFTNLRKGKYLLLALKEELSDYIYNPQLDKIGFYADTLELPRDSVLSRPIVIFKEELPYKFRRAQESKRGKILFGFEGKRDSLRLQLLSQVSDSFRSISRFELDKDTLNYWFTPLKSIDSLNFILSRNQEIDTVTVRLRKKQIDSLAISVNLNKILNFRDTFFIQTNTPIVKIDTTKIRLVASDSIPLTYSLLESDIENKIGLLFEKKPSTDYKINLYPKALTDIYEVSHDTLNYQLSTKAIDDYGQITMDIINVNSKNLIIELLTGNKNDVLVDRKIIAESGAVVFDLLPPGKYTIRAIVDENRNNKWDTGNFLKRRLPERIIYHEQMNQAELRANNFLEESFTID